MCCCPVVVSRGGRGFRLVHEEAHHSFGHDLIGRNWLLDLYETTG